MRCHVYKSLVRADTYVYLARKDDFEVLPELLRQSLGELQPVMTLELGPQRRLARVEVAAVRTALGASGYFLQLPPAPGLLA